MHCGAEFWIAQDWTKNNTELAAATGVHISTVERWRADVGKRRGDRCYKKLIDWDLSNEEVARRFGLKPRTVSARRLRDTGINWSETQARAVKDWSLTNREIERAAGRGKNWASKWRGILGKRKTPAPPPDYDWAKPNKDLASKHGVSEESVRRARRKANAPSASEILARSADWSLTDVEIAKQFGRSNAWAGKWRKRLGKPESPGKPKKKGIDWDAQPLGEVPDIELARRLGVHSSTVSNARQRRGIEFTEACKAEQARRVDEQRRAAHHKAGEATRRKWERIMALRWWADMRSRVWSGIEEATARWPWETLDFSDSPLCDRPIRPTKRQCDRVRLGSQVESHRICTGCDDVLPAERFRHSECGETRGTCRRCSNARKQAYRAANPHGVTISKLRRRIRDAVTKRGDYSDGSMGVDWHAIADHLGPRPTPHHQIDHVIPLRAFDLGDPEQFALANSPENHIWLSELANSVKADKLPDGRNARSHPPMPWTRDDVLAARSHWVSWRRLRLADEHHARPLS